MKNKKNFLTSYIQDARKLVESAFNHKLNEQEFEELKKFIKFSNNSVDDRKVLFSNTYTKHDKEVRLIDAINFIINNEPILTGNGTLFKPESVGGKNLSGSFIQFLMKSRKEFKTLMFECISTISSERLKKDKADKKVISEAEAGRNLNDMKQSSFKVFTNAYYGSIGMQTFIFHDKNCAPAVTSVGASAITSIVQKFEGTIGDHWHFKYASDIIDFIDDVINKPVKYEIEFNKVIDPELVYNRLAGKILEENPNESILKLVKDKIERIDSQDLLNRLYFTNNFYEFIKEPQIVELVREIFKYEILSGNIKDVNGMEEKLNEEKEGSGTEFVENIKTFSDLVLDYCYTVKSYEDRMNFADNTKKRVVLVVDTDSSFVYTGPFVKYFEKKFKKKDEEWGASRYITLANIMIYMVCHLSQEIITDFCIRINIEEQRRHWLSLKNEFLFKRIMLTRNMKNYAGSIILQEGNILYPAKFDMKGLAIKKVTVNKFTRKYFADILKNDILESNKIDLKLILNKFIDYENMVKESIMNGKTEFSTPARYGNINNYKFPFREPVVRGTIIWNEAYKDQKIPSMTNVNTFKILASTKEDFDKIVKSNNFTSEENEILEKIEKAIFENEDLKNYGFSIIAIPKDIEKTPNWIIPFIDIQSMIDDNISNALILLESLGVQVVKTNNVNRMSNIISF